MRRFLLLLVLLFGCSPASAAPAGDVIALDGRLCHYASDEPFTVSTIFREKDRFVCDGAPRHGIAEFDWLRADGLGFVSTAKEPWFLRFRNTFAQRMSVAFRYADGHVEIIHASGGDLAAYATGGQMIAFRVPPRSVPVESFVLGVEGDPGVRPVMRSPQFVSATKLRRDAAQNNFLFGGLAGLLMAAIAFNLGFYGALRARFQIEMVGMATAFFAYVAIWSGAVEQMGFMTGIELRLGGALVLLAISSYTMVRFSLSFLERTSIWRPAAQTAQAASMAAIISAMGLLAADWSTIRFFDTSFHVFSAITLVALIAVFAIALWRGSPAARFIVIGMAPVVVAAFVRVAYALDLATPSNVGESALFVGATAMTIIMCYAVAHRVKEIQKAHEEARQRHGELTLRAERDGLTGLLNRRTFIEQVEVRLNFDVGDRLPAFIILDLDYFKQVNDTFGHEAGDNVLRQAAELLARTCRTGDIVGRLGGEEFGILVAVREAKEARIAAERLRMAISTCAIHKVVPGLTHISASIGVAVAGERRCSWSDLYQRADQALYAAKGEGRNRVRVAPQVEMDAQAA